MKPMQFTACGAVSGLSFSGTLARRGLLNHFVNQFAVGEVVSLGSTLDDGFCGSYLNHFSFHVVDLDGAAGFEQFAGINACNDVRRDLACAETERQGYRCTDRK